MIEALGEANVTFSCVTNALPQAAGDHHANVGIGKMQMSSFA